MPKRIYSDLEVEVEAIRRFVRHVESADIKADWAALPASSRAYWLRRTERRMVRERRERRQAEAVLACRKETL